MVAFDNGSSTKRRLQAEQSVQSLNFDGIPIGLRRSRPYGEQRNDWNDRRLD